jgi:hypothetical protein
VARPTVRAAAGDFASATPGWVELVIEPSGAGEAKFVSGISAEVLFQQRLPDIVMPAAGRPSAPKSLPPSPIYATYGKRHVWQLGRVLKFFLGSFYSAAYDLKLSYDVLNLQTEQGGLTPTDMGGGLQTKTLRLTDPLGGAWAARSVTKDSSRILPWPQNRATLVNRVIDHGMTATHPEAALAVPALADAVGVLHVEPRLMYLPDQEVLGPFRGYVTDELVLLERRPKAPKAGQLPDSLTGPLADDAKIKFETTGEVTKKITDNPWDNRVDQEAMLRARLLDILIGDWDRNLDQWVFVVKRDADGAKTYTPVARDRDQAMSNYDGLLLSLARPSAPSARSLQPFNGDYGPVDWLVFTARDTDAVFLNRVPHERWLAIAKEAQAALTDQVIDDAFKGWHPEAYALDGARMAKALKSRRDKLLKVADAYFANINRRIDIVGSPANDTFELWFETGGAVRVAVHEKSKKGKDRAPFFDRTFYPKETQELRLYALAGDDTLLVHGGQKTPIDIRFVGGTGHDKVLAALDSGARPLAAKAILFYDSKDGATIDQSIEVRDERSQRAALNQYDQYENHDLDFGVFVPSLVVNPDQYLYIGGTYTYTVQGFKLHPFAQQHALTASFAASTLGVGVDYAGLFPGSAYPLDQEIDLSLRTPNNARNFFGLTNRYVPDAHPDYYRVRQALYSGRYGLSYGFGSTVSKVGMELVGQVIDTERTLGRFVTVSPDVRPADFGARFFSGARLYAQVNTIDDPVLPTRGIVLKASAEGRGDWLHLRDFSTTLKAGVGFAFPFDWQRRFVLLSHLGTEGIVGDHPFYFAPTVGGLELRAYRFQQFAGDFALAQTTDLRMDVLRILHGIPGTLGLNLSLDHGRVFGTSTPSHVYHMSYGGGVWWSVLDAFGMSLAYNRSLEGASRVVFSVGALFLPSAL